MEERSWAQAKHKTQNIVSCIYLFIFHLFTDFVISRSIGSITSWMLFYLSASSISSCMLFPVFTNKRTYSAES